MRVYRQIESLPSSVKGAAVAVGNFDGVHLGHQAVIGEAGKIAKSHRVPWAVMTFEPHPRSVFSPEAPPFRLTPSSQKAQLIGGLGVHFLVILHFDERFAQQSARDFVKSIIVDGLAARCLISGHNFAFGHDREGTPELLLNLGGEFGFDFTCVQEVRDPGGEPYSSSRIRDYLRQGQPSSAARLLGRAFEISGVVVEGEKRGRTIGYPTANLRLGEYLCPAMGVYAVRVCFDGDPEGTWRLGVANLGKRPTFGGGDVVLEVHVFDFEGDLYGQHLRVALVDYLRAEKKFDGLEGLKAQIADDGAKARKVLASA